VEQAESGQAPTGFRLNPHGRYSHSEDYLRSTLLSVGLAAPAIVPAMLRMEAGRPVPGLIVTARKEV